MNHVIVSHPNKTRLSRVFIETLAQHTANLNSPREEREKIIFNVNMDEKRREEKKLLLSSLLFSSNGTARTFILTFFKFFPSGIFYIYSRVQKKLPLHAWTSSSNIRRA
jgi:hypothetical protein